MKKEKSKSYQQRLSDYEREKRVLYSKGLTGYEFERAVKRLAEKYMV